MFIMQRKRPLLKYLILIFIAPVSLGFAQDMNSVNPGIALESIIKAMKAEESIQKLFDNVDWSNAFEDLPTGKRNFLNVSNAAEFQYQMRLRFSDPARFLQEDLKRVLVKIPKSQRKFERILIEKKVREQQQEAEKWMRYQSDQLVNADYDVSDWSIDHDRAAVIVNIKNDKGLKKKTFKMIKRGKEWKISSLNWFLISKR